MLCNVKVYLRQLESVGIEGFGSDVSVHPG
jgi:hypothetical protein